MTVKFLFNVNVGESIGTQTENGIQAVLDDYIDKCSQTSSGSTEESLNEKDDLVTINVYEALKRFYTRRWKTVAG